MVNFKPNLDSLRPSVHLCKKKIISERKMSLTCQHFTIGALFDDDSEAELQAFLRSREMVNKVLGCICNCVESASICIARSFA